MKRVAVFLAVLAVIGLAVSASFAQGAKPRVLLKTNLGDITVELDPAAAPKTVENFLAYVRDGHYDGTIFHRVIEGFMIQGGGFDTDYKRLPTRAPIVNEADKGLSNDRGTIAMARTGDPHSATDQFFINSVTNASLNFTAKNERGWGYTAFGRVVKGLATVLRISRVETGARGPFGRDAPLDQVVLEKATIVAP
jgi:cyclophilin family peptidyl-prolyl cis-trans isomerase